MICRISNLQVLVSTLGSIYVDAPEDCVFYVAKTFTVEEDGDYELAFDSDDGMKAWVNGMLIHTFAESRGLFYAGEDLVSVSLREGLNIVVIKVVNARGTTGFAFDVRRPNWKTKPVEAIPCPAGSRKKNIATLPDMDEATPEELLELTRQAAFYSRKNSTTGWTSS